MTRICYDSTTPSAIPADAAMVAGYSDGIYAWSAADWARFSNAVQVRIVVNSITDDGDVLDIEPGNNDALASVDWTIARRAAGAVPTVYCGNWAPGYTMADVVAAHNARGVPPPQFWLADFDGVQAIPDGCIAKQYANAQMLGINADASVVADFWPGVDPMPDPCADLRNSLISINTRATAMAAEVEAIIEDSAGYDTGESAMRLPPRPEDVVPASATTAFNWSDRLNAFLNELFSLHGLIMVGIIAGVIAKALAGSGLDPHWTVGIVAALTLVSTLAAGIAGAFGQSAVAVANLARLGRLR